MQSFLEFNEAVKSKEADKDLPFTPDVKKTKPSTAGKYGSAYSTVRNLARQALEKAAKKQVKEEAEDLEEAELEEASKGYAPGWMLKADPELAKKVKANTQGYKDLKKYAGKDIPKKEETELQESSDAHKVMVTVSDPHHTMVTKRKEQIMKHVIVRAGDKGEAQAKAEAFYKKKGYKVHGSEYHSKQPATSMKTEGN